MLTIKFSILILLFFKILKKIKFERLKRKEFLAAKRIHVEAHNIQDILGILVPKFVQKEMGKGEKMGLLTEQPQNDVSILFCDFCDFDQMINQEGTNIVRILDEIFRNFDHYCLKHGIQKIEVILNFIKVSIYTI